MDRRAELGRALEHYRIGRGISQQQEFAELLGLKTRVTVAALERGRPVKVQTLYAVDKHFGWPLGVCHQFIEGQRAELPAPLGKGSLDTAPVDAEEFTDPTEVAIMAITELPESTKRAWVARLRAARARLREQRGPNGCDAEQQSG